MRRLLGFAVFVVLMTPLVVLARPVGAQSPNSVEVVQVDTTRYPRVSLTVSLPESSPGDVTAETLTLTENGEDREITVTESAAVGLRVALVLDTSGSMAGAPLEAAKQAARSFVGNLPDGANAALVSFAETASLEAPFTDDHALLDQTIAGLSTGRPGTALYDGIAAAVAALGPSAGSDRVLVVLSDGEDSESAITQDELAERLAASDVQFTGIALRTADGNGDQLRPLAEATGGRVLDVEDPALLSGLYGLLAASLGNRYEIVFESKADTPANELAIAFDGEELITHEVTYRSLAGDVTTDITADPTVVEEGGLLAAEWLPWMAALLIASGIVACVVLVQGDSERKELEAMVTSWDERLGSPLEFDDDIEDPQPASPAANPSELLSGVAGGLSDAAARVLERQGKSDVVDGAIQRAGLAMRPGELGATVLTMSMAGGAVGYLFGGTVTALVGVVAPVALAPLVLKFMAARRRKKFGNQLGDTLMLISGALKAGYGLAQSLDSVAAEAPSPTSEEFSRALLETRLGLSLEQALDGVAERVQCEDFEWVVNAVKINASVGGDLSEILDQVGETIRARTKIRRQIAALAAEGKISALVLFSLPPGLVLFISGSNPDYVAPLFSTTTGNIMLGVALMLMLMGGAWLKKIVNPEI